jgi:hypothetical protein
MSLSIYWKNVKTRYPRYTWVGNRISPDAMAEMYMIRQATGKPITRQVAEAVEQYLKAGRR